jgi:TatD DNase family protein
MLFDTHAHLDAGEFSNDLDQRIMEWFQGGISGILAVSTSAKSSQASIEIARRHPSVYASAGIHPNYCHEATEQDWERIKLLASCREVVALGETGLDKYWNFAPFERQQDFFGRHIALSHETGLPFIVHMRDCESEMLQMLERTANNGRLNGIMHSFCGSAMAAEQCLEWGMMISFSGMATYPKNSEIRDIARDIPAGRLLLETDAPWLSPHPVRGVKPNTPALMRHTAMCLAEVRGISLPELAETTSANARRIFRIDSRQEALAGGSNH